ncbi:hypothetical protein TNCV_4590711 [Trichonephila clavipes]|nr:hypothetical protein TNCV_4590711 [Trichonephila clavipes]
MASILLHLYTAANEFSSFRLPPVTPGPDYCLAHSSRPVEPPPPIRGMTWRCHIVLGKILLYAERCEAWCVVTLQPPIVSDGWAARDNQFHSDTHPTITV